MQYEENSRQGADCRYFCASLLDIQGAGQSLLDLEAKWKAKPNGEEATFALRQELGKVFSLREQLLRFTKLEALSRMPEAFDQWAQEAQDAFRTSIGTPFYTWSFSDTALLYSAVSDNNANLRLGAVYGVLASTAMVALSGLSTGLVLRGAVALRLGMRLPNDELYGPILHCVHHLESKCAYWPRVLVDLELVKRIDHHATANASTELEKMNKQVASMCMSLLVQCPDKRTWMVDLFSPQITGALPDEAMLGVISQVCDFIQSQQDALRAVDPQRLLPKYEALGKYVRSRLIARGIVVNGKIVPQK